MSKAMVVTVVACLVALALPAGVMAAEVTIAADALEADCGSLNKTITAFERAIAVSSADQKARKTLIGHVDRLQSRLEPLCKLRPHGRGERQIKIDDARAIVILDDVLAALVDAETAIEEARSLSRSESREMVQEMRGAMERVRSLRALVRKSEAPVEAPVVVTPVVAPVVVSQPVVVPQAVDKATLKSLKTSVGKAAFADRKVALIEDAARTGYFTTDQVVELLGSLSFDDDKVKAAAALYPVTVDPVNWHKVYNAISFESSRDELRARVKSLKPLGQ